MRAFTFERFFAKNEGIGLNLTPPAEKVPQDAPMA